MPKTECLVIKAFNGELLITIDEQILELKELNRNERFSKEFNEKDEVKERTKYIPPMTHPWKLASFKKTITKSTHESCVCLNKRVFMPRKLLTSKEIFFTLLEFNDYCFHF